MQTLPRMQWPPVLELTGQYQQYQVSMAKSLIPKMNLLILEQSTTSTQDQHDLGSIAKPKLSLKYASSLAVFFPSQRISSFSSFTSIPERTSPPCWCWRGALTPAQVMCIFHQEIRIRNKTEHCIRPSSCTPQSGFRKRHLSSVCFSECSSPHLSIQPA